VQRNVERLSNRTGVNSSGDWVSREFGKRGAFRRATKWIQMQGKLRRNGVKVKLQEQTVSKVLTIAAWSVRGEVISREGTASAGFGPRDTFVDFDHSLNAAI